jgi:hypothetical protein
VSAWSSLSGKCSGHGRGKRRNGGLAPPSNPGFAELAQIPESLCPMLVQHSTTGSGSGPSGGV